MNLLLALTVVSGLFGGGCSGGSCGGGSCSGGGFSMGASMRSGGSCSTGACGSQMPMPIQMSGPTSYASPQPLGSPVVMPAVVSYVPAAPIPQAAPKGYKVVCDGQSCRLVKITTTTTTAERIPYAEPGPPMHVPSVIVVEQTQSAVFQFYQE